MEPSLLARLKDIIQRQNDRDETGNTSETDDESIIPSDELEALIWGGIADPHGDSGIVIREDPKVLDTCDLKGVARYLKGSSGYGSGKRQVVVMAGAGISTSAGIPDFRSPKTGLYANLARLNLPYPEAVFDIRFFRNNPLPFYTLAHELYPGKFRPTVTHSFIKLLADKGMLHTCFTQNIDTLERLAGVPASKLVEAHGSFAENHCIDCGTEFPGDLMRELVMTRNPKAPGGVNVAECKKPGCGGLVKPDIVFFGESLPKHFHTSLASLPFADIALVIGTSLTVHPFAQLPQMVSDRCPRVLMNMERVGYFDRPDDVVHLAPCDDAVRELCDLLGWRDELEAVWAATEGLVVSAGAPVTLPVARSRSDPGTVRGAKERVESGGTADLAEMLAGKLKLGDDAKKNAEGLATSTVAALETKNNTAQRSATASIRVSLEWPPYPASSPDEESVLVLTAPSGHYVDVRITLPTRATEPVDAVSPTTSTAPASLAPINDPAVVPSGSSLSWAFAGIASRPEDGKGGRWSRIVDSRSLDPAGESDEGQEELLADGDTRETGVMDGKEHIEVWRPLDIGGEPEVWVAERQGSEAGMMIRVGEWAQGVTRSGELCAFRAKQIVGEWKDVWRIGAREAFPTIGKAAGEWKMV